MSSSEKLDTVSGGVTAHEIKPSERSSCEFGVNRQVVSSSMVSLDMLIKGLIT